MASLTVLVVDDELLIRMCAVDMFTEAGFNTVEASSADEAIALLEDRSDIRLVFTDIQMPGSMDGLALVAAIRKRWPPVRLIVTSGRYSADDLALPSEVAFIPKPYDWAGVHSRIRQLRT
jgi:two-component system, response regulator PdtaR